VYAIMSREPTFGTTDLRLELIRRISKLIERNRISARKTNTRGKHLMKLHVLSTEWVKCEIGT
jgi:hypothetical protein